MNNPSIDNEILSTISKEQWSAIAVMAAAMASQGLNVQPNVVPFNSEDNLYFRVTRLLKKIGAKANLKGYPYLREAVVMVYGNQKYMDKITKEMYPEIAKKFGTTPSRVERAIRHIIERAFDTGDLDFLNEVFTCNPSRGKPTNGEAIASLAEYLKYYM